MGIKEKQKQLKNLVNIDGLTKVAKETAGNFQNQVATTLNRTTNEFVKQTNKGLQSAADQLNKGLQSTGDQLTKGLQSAADKLDNVKLDVNLNKFIDEENT